MAEDMENMDPEQLQKMMEAKGAGKGGPMGMDPSAMSDMMKNMPPEAIAEAAKAMGTDIDPAMAAKAAEQMKNMKPEQMERMMKMSAKLQDMGVKPGQKPE